MVHRSGLTLQNHRDNTTTGNSKKIGLEARRHHLLVGRRHEWEIRFLLV